MKNKDNELITISLSKDIMTLLQGLARKERHTISQQVSIIVHNFFKDYGRILELQNDKDFGVITEEKLRQVLENSSDKGEYKYEDIEDLSFEELLVFWKDTFLEG